MPNIDRHRGIAEQGNLQAGGHGGLPSGVPRWIFGGSSRGDDDHALAVALLQRAVLVDLGLDVGFGEINLLLQSPAAQLSDATARARGGEQRISVGMAIPHGVSVNFPIH